MYRDPGGRLRLLDDCWSLIPLAFAIPTSRLQCLSPRLASVKPLLLDAFEQALFFYLPTAETHYDEQVPLRRLGKCT